MTPDDPPTLLDLPLEVRHHIFRLVAARTTHPKMLISSWFERMDVEDRKAEMLARKAEMLAQRLAVEGNGHEDGEEEGEDTEEEDRDEDEVGHDEGDEGGEEEEDGEQDEETQDDDGTAVSTVADALGATAANSQTTTQAPQNPAAADQSAKSPTADQSTANSSQDMSVAQDSTVAATQPDPAAAPTQGQDQADVEGADADIAADSEEDVDAEDADKGEDSQIDDEEGDEDDEEGEDEDDEGDDEDDEDDEDNEDDGDSDEEMAEEDEDGDTAAQSLPAPVITAHNKWRHIPQFMRITHCPPPVELLLTSKQLNIEAKNWFYDVAVLRIEATGSFAHTSFFEEAFGQITEAAFSPMEDIRRVEITFVWDTTWLRSDQADCAGAIFPALLRQRATFVTGILAQAPNLSEVTIHWHDSAEDGESLDLMNDILMGFLDLRATVKVEKQYIAADAKPYRKSIAGKQRVEFQRIIDNGLESLF